MPGVFPGRVLGGDVRVSLDLLHLGRQSVCWRARCFPGRVLGRDVRVSLDLLPLGRPACAGVPGA